MGVLHGDRPPSAILFDESKTLVFRDHEARSRVTMSGHEVVDIRVDTASDLCVTLLWDVIEGTRHHFSSCDVTTDEVNLQAFIDSIRQRDYQMLYQLCRLLFVKHGAKVQHVTTNPLTLYMVHENKTSCEAMLTDQRVHELISKCVSQGVGSKLTWFHGEIPLIAESQFAFNQENNSRLEELQNDLQKLQDSCDAHMKEQSAFNSNIQVMIEKLSLGISQMNTITTLNTNETGDFNDGETAFRDQAVVDIAGLENHTIERNSDFTSGGNSNRDIIGQEQQALMSKYVSQQEFHSNMSDGDDDDNANDEDEEEDEDEGGDTSFVVSCSGDQFGRTEEQSQITYVQETNDNLAKEEGRTQKEDEKHGITLTTVAQAIASSDGFISDDPVTQDHGNDAYGAGNGVNTNDFTDHDEQYPTFKPQEFGGALSSSARKASLALAERFLKHQRIHGTQNLVETIAIALTDDEMMPTKSKSLDTILCLDTSSSLKEEGFAEMKKLAFRFIDGIEEMAEKQDIEENIAVVAFGDGSRIVHFLSNDYGSVRDSIINLEMGGTSPLFEALLVSLCAFKGRGGVLNISGVHKLRPRLIVLSDGRPTDEREQLAGDQQGQSSTATVVKLMKLLPRFEKHHKDYPNPVTWIPVGNANVNLLTVFAKMSGGKVLQGEEMMQLCKYQWIQRTVGNIFAVIKGGAFPDTGNMTDDIKACIDALSGDLNQTDKNEVLEAVTAKFDKSGPDDDEDDFETPTESEDPNLPHLGARVIRGPDWDWDDQDSDGPGTVVSHNPGDGLVLRVHWDNGQENRYRFGNEGKYDVFEVHDMPRQITSDMLIEVGCEVTRGPDWMDSYGDKDGGEGGVGVILRKNNSGEVMVRWNLTHIIMKCRYGKDDKLDLKLRDPSETLLDITRKEQFEASRNMEHWESRGKGQWEGEGEGEGERRCVWQWEDEQGQWHLYSEEDLLKLEKEYTRNRNGSCVVKRQGNSFRVLFNQKIERGLTTETRYNIRRIEITEEEYVVMKQISKLDLYR